MNLTNMLRGNVRYRPSGTVSYLTGRVGTFVADLELPRERDCQVRVTKREGKKAECSASRRRQRLGSDGKPAHGWGAPLEDSKQEQARPADQTNERQGGVNSRRDRILPS
jgi:hypothetical protein